MNGIAEGLGIDPAIVEQLIAEASQLKEDGQRKMSVSDELFAQLQGAMQNFYSQKQQVEQEDIAKMQQSHMQQMGALAGRSLFEFGVETTELAAADFIKPSIGQRLKRMGRKVTKPVAPESFKGSSRNRPNFGSWLDPRDRMKRPSGQQRRTRAGIDSRNLDPRGKKYKKRARGEGYKHKYAEKRIDPRTGKRYEKANTGDGMERAQEARFRKKRKPLAGAQGQGVLRSRVKQVREGQVKAKVPAPRTARARNSMEKLRKRGPFSSSSSSVDGAGGSILADRERNNPRRALDARIADRERR